MNKDLVSVIFGTILMFVFVVFMFQSFNQSQEIKLIQTQIQMDSITLNQQKLLQISDSLIIEKQKEFRRMLNNQSTQLKKINSKLEEIGE